MPYIPPEVVKKAREVEALADAILATEDGKYKTRGSVDCA